MALCITPPSMATYLPCLPGSANLSLCVQTSFVLPAHIQGVCLASNQGLALWKIFLPNTGSFFFQVLLTCCYPSCSGTLRRTFSRFFSWYYSFSVIARSTSRSSLNAHSNYDRVFLYWLHLNSLCCLHLWMPDITKQLSGIIVHSLCQNCIEHPDHLTCHSYYGLHLFQWILFPRSIILMDRTELRILSYQRDRCFI